MATISRAADGLDALNDIEIHFDAFVRGLNALGVHRGTVVLDEVTANVNGDFDTQAAVVEAGFKLRIDRASRRDVVTKLRRLADYVEKELELEL